MALQNDHAMFIYKSTSVLTFSNKLTKYRNTIALKYYCIIELVYVYIIAISTSKTEIFFR